MIGDKGRWFVNCHIFPPKRSDSLVSGASRQTVWNICILTAAIDTENTGKKGNLWICWCILLSLFYHKWSVADHGHWQHCLIQMRQCCHNIIFVSVGWAVFSEHCVHPQTLKMKYYLWNPPSRHVCNSWHNSNRILKNDVPCHLLTYLFCKKAWRWSTKRGGASPDYSVGFFFAFDHTTHNPYATLRYQGQKSSEGLQNSEYLGSQATWAFGLMGLKWLVLWNNVQSPFREALKFPTPPKKAPKLGMKSKICDVPDFHQDYFIFQ